MGLLDKIEDKLSGSSQHKDDRRTLEKANYDDNYNGNNSSTGVDSKLRHPISSSNVDNTGYGNNTSSSYTNSPLADRNRDGYGTARTTGTHDNTGSMPGGFPNNDSSNADRYDDKTYDRGYGANHTTNTTTATTTHTTGPTSAVRSGTTTPHRMAGTTQSTDYADQPHSASVLKSGTGLNQGTTGTAQSTDYAEYPSRSQKGGILNNNNQRDDNSRYTPNTGGILSNNRDEDSRYNSTRDDRDRDDDPRFTTHRENRDSIPLAGGRQVGNPGVTSSDDRYGRDNTTSNQNFGRDNTTSDRNYGRDNIASDRNYGRDNTTSDRNYDRDDRNYDRDDRKFGRDDNHHYGRDAGLVGGVGAAGVGVYEYGKHHGNDRDDNNITSRGYETSAGTRLSGSDPHHGLTSRGYETNAPTSNTPYTNTNTNRDTSSRVPVPASTATAGTAAAGLTTATPKTGVSGPAVSQRTHAQKMGEAYAAGYRDGYEHAKSEVEEGRPL